MNGTITAWNAGAERLFGWASQDVLGNPFPTVFTPEDRAAGGRHADVEQALRASFNGHLSKPASTETFQSTIGKLKLG